MTEKNFSGWKNKKMRRNKYAQTAQSEIDLHGFTITEAAQALNDFLEEAKDKKYERVRIITGKGLHSENGRSILNGYVKNILEKQELKFSDAKIYDGGSGAIDVQLQ